MADTFTRTEVNMGNSMTSQFGLITPVNGLTGILMQSLQLTYAQQVTRVYEIGSVGAKTSIYYVSGRANGQLNVAHIIGPATTIKTFYSSYSDVCAAQGNNLTLTLGTNFCGGGAGLTYLAKYCVLVQVGMSISAQEFVINENSSLMFSGLEIT